MKMKEKIISTLVTVVLLLSIVLCITVVGQVMSKGYVSVAGHSVFRVATGSMEPTISTGALLLSGPADIEELQVGDIICFRSLQSNMLGQVITHRVVNIYQNDKGEPCLETRGDANTVSDGYLVTKSNLVGKVLWYSGKDNVGAKVVGGLSNRIGFLSLIVIPVLVVGGMILHDSMKNIQKELMEIKENLEEHERTEEDLRAQLNEEEYQEMLARIRAELLEELKNSASEQIGETAKTE